MIKHYIWLKDLKTNEVFDVDSKKAEQFMDEYESPGDLIVIKVYYCDGSGFNGKTSKIAFGTCNNIKTIEIPFDKTNNECEYLSMLSCMVEAEDHSLILSDSQLIVNQILDKYKCNYNSLIYFRNICKNLLKKKNLSIKWIPREENIAGIELEKLVKLQRLKKGYIKNG